MNDHGGGDPRRARQPDALFSAPLWQAPQRRPVFPGGSVFDPARRVKPPSRVVVDPRIAARALPPPPPPAPPVIVLAPHIAARLRGPAAPRDPRPVDMVTIGAPDFSASSALHRAIVARAQNARARGAGSFFTPDWFDSETTIRRRVEEAIRAGEKIPGYQRLGVETLARHKGFILADEPGLGKTVQALLAAPVGHRCGIMVMAPAGLQVNWAREIQKWRKDYEVVQVDRHDWKWPSVGEVVVCRWESLPKPEMKRKRWIVELGKRPSHKVLAIIDEGHRGKNPSAKCSIVARAIADQSDACWVLTGTAMANKPGDFYEVARLADLQRYLASSKKEFTKTWYTMDATGKAESAHPLAKELVKVVCLRRTRAEVDNERPELEKRTIWVQCSKSALKAQFDDIVRAAGGEEALVAKITSEALGSAERAQWEGALASIKLEAAKAKLPHALSWIRDREEEGEPIVVFSCHPDVIEQVTGRKRGWGSVVGGMTRRARQEVIDRFQRGELAGIGITTAGAEGITLTKSNVLLRIDRDWSPWINAQVEGRIDRFGQTRKTTVYDLRATDLGIDEVVDKVCDRKSKYQRESGLL